VIRAPRHHVKRGKPRWFPNGALSSRTVKPRNEVPDFRPPRDSTFLQASASSAIMSPRTSIRGRIGAYGFTTRR
jgi:hypothetical protein